MLSIPALSYQDLHEFALDCEKRLLVETPHEFIYPTEVRNNNDETLWEEHIPKIKQINDNLLSSLRHNANLYAIYKRHSTENEWQPVYVGERKSKGMRERITQHLITKNSETGSKLDEVKEIIRLGGFIGVSFLKVEPESLRLYVEEHIISNNKDNLLWNIHGKG